MYSLNVYLLWVSVGQRSFAFHGPTVWNSVSLPSALRDSSLSLNTFKRRLKIICWTVMNATRRRCGVL